jgi:hypothetical protein
MATRLVERAIRVEPGAERHTLDVDLPEGTVVVAILQNANGGAALLRVDPAQPDEPRRFVSVRGEDDANGVLLTAEEEAGAYLGSFWGYARARGQRRDLYHVFEVAAPTP